MRCFRTIAFCAALVATCIATPAIAIGTDTAQPEAEPAVQHPLRTKRHHASSTTDVTAAPAAGNASFYARKFAGRKTASGERYDPAALTAAHRTLPLGTQVRVVNPANDKSVVVTVNDRGPGPKNRIIDVSSAAADALGMKKAGVTQVRTEVVGKTDLPSPAPPPSEPEPAPR